MRRFASPELPSWVDPAFLVFQATFLTVARDTLRNYYARTARLLSFPFPEKGVCSMANGNHPPSQQPPKPTPKGGGKKAASSAPKKR